MELDKTLAKVESLKKQKNLQEGAVGDAIGQMVGTAASTQKNVIGAVGNGVKNKLSGRGFFGGMSNKTRNTLTNVLSVLSNLENSNGSGNGNQQEQVPQQTNVSSSTANQETGNQGTVDSATTDPNTVKAEGGTPEEKTNAAVSGQATNDQANDQVNSQTNDTEKNDDDQKKEEATQVSESWNRVATLIRALELKSIGERKNE
jgi:hypothetical protein